MLQERVKKHAKTSSNEYLASLMGTSGLVFEKLRELLDEDHEDLAKTNRSGEMEDEKEETTVETT